MSDEKRSASDYINQLNALGNTGLLSDLSALRAENREFETLINDAATLVALPSIDEMIDFVTKRFLDRFIPQRLLFLIEDPSGGGPRQYLFRNMQPDPRSVPDDFYAPLSDWFKDNPHPISLENLSLKKAGADFGPFIADFAPRMLIPLVGIGGVHGLALLGPRILTDEYSGPELMYVNRLIRFLSIGIQNSLHHESSITDAKTGLFNHRYFTRRLDEELARVIRHETEAGLIMIDVDHFKKFNDTWGHLAGDEVLKAIARAVQGCVRVEDIASRFGGEEFCILAIECKPNSLMELAERVRLAVQELRVPFEEHCLQVTVSLGCCHIDGKLCLDAKGYVEKADKALYLSKSGGRNRSTSYHFGLLDRAKALRKHSCPDEVGEVELMPLG